MDPIQFPISVAITNGLCWVFTKVFPELRKFAPIVALQAGILSYCLLAGFSAQNIAYGLVSGLSAVGAFSSAKNISKGVVEIAS